jgi:hypothetical protein
MSKKVKNSNLVGKLIGFILLSTLFEISICVVIPIIKYCIQYATINLDVIFEIAKYYLVFSIFKLFYMAYPILYFFVLRFYFKIKEGEFKNIEVSMINGGLYLILSLLYGLILPDTRDFFVFSLDGLYSGFFYYAFIGGIIGAYFSNYIIKRIGWFS